MKTKAPDAAYWQQGHAFLIISPSSNWQSILDEVLKRWSVSRFDLTTIGQDKAISIEEARNLQSDCLKQPSQGQIRLGVLWGLEKISEEAANSLLKVIEEPPEKTRFLLFSTTQQVLSTISSRCQTWVAPQDRNSHNDLLIPLDKKLDFAKVIVDIKSAAETGQATKIIDQWTAYLLANGQNYNKQLHWLIEARRALEETAVNQEALLESAWLNLTEGFDFIGLNQDEHKHKREN